ncbi:hypothetical protein AXF42_Ash000276 [Apostasia shenzhenica]|uniref:Uncharacterized protein n=1 Tax=Apostasia shenzhenica TaxID=1088818 RepID=A0A2I0AFW7_9ASPA|nr:hypothetical protein AXF42_Ash000276 [Apostasia shenzhenica]
MVSEKGALPSRKRGQAHSKGSKNLGKEDPSLRRKEGKQVEGKRVVVEDMVEADFGGPPGGERGVWVAEKSQTTKWKALRWEAREQGPPQSEKVV